MRSPVFCISDKNVVSRSETDGQFATYQYYVVIGRRRGPRSGPVHVFYVDSSILEPRHDDGGFGAFG